MQIFLKAHNERNLAEYEGRMEIGEQLLSDLIRCTKLGSGGRKAYASWGKVTGTVEFANDTFNLAANIASNNQPFRWLLIKDQFSNNYLRDRKNSAINASLFRSIEALRARLGRSNRRSSLSLILRPDGLPRYRDKASSLSATTTEF